MLREISEFLYHLKDCKNFFLTWTPELTDFRRKKEVFLYIHTNKEILKILIPSNLPLFISILSKVVLAKNKFVIGWNLKELFSYLKFNVEPHWEIPADAEIFDLKLGESFLNIKEDAPKTYSEASKRAGVILNNPEFIKINKHIYKPLIVNVLPKIETTGIANIEKGLEYCCYQVEGQKNGRLNIILPDDKFFNPHNLTNEQKSKYSSGNEKRFLVFDFKHMEASVLAWLSKDKILDNIIASNEDIYSKIWCIISGEGSCSKDKRELIKSIFLPIVFGSGVNRISELTGLPTKASTHLIDSIKKNFTTAFEWVENQQEQLKQTKIIRDCFGRVLDFGENSGREIWSVRNAIIQAPASLICIEKLVHLYKNTSYLNYDNLLKIVTSIHDAYVCIINERDSDSIIKLAKNILEIPSEIAPGLKLKVEVSVGKDWGNLSKK